MNTCACKNLADGNGTMCHRCAALHELGLKAGATDAEVKTAYRLYVKAWHPDRFPGDEKSKRAAQEKLKAINSAYDFLTSPSSKGQTYRPKASTPPARPQEPTHQKQSSTKQPPPAGGRSQTSPPKGNAGGQAPPPKPSAARRWGIFFGLLAGRFSRVPLWARLASVAVLAMAVITAGLAVGLPATTITALGREFDRPHNHAFARTFYRFACARNDKNACYSAAEDYEGSHVPRMNYLSKACEMGNANGCESLGDAYYYDYSGSLGAKDYSQAEAYYSKACEMGNAEGCDGLSTLGFDYELGVHVERDISRAENLYSKVCEKGNNEGCKGLVGIGFSYVIGNYVKQDSLRAASLYSKACDAGIADGCGDLGDLYLQGNGLKQDFHSALALFSKACNGGDAGGCWDEGQIYLNGWGQAKDKEKARSLFNKGCTMGLKDACDFARNPRPLPLK